MAATTSPEERTVSVPIPHPPPGTPTSATYTLRSIRPDDPKDLDVWAEFCSSCFARKPNPPPAAYFVRHYRNDPRGDAGLVRVLEYHVPEGGRRRIIASSLRVFRRTISDGAGSRLEAGGIGEVCTRPDHRRRGLSRLLIRDAIESMARLELDVSLLHAGPELAPFYERGGGYRSVRSRWRTVTVDRRRLSGVPPGRLGARPAIFPDDAPRLASLHGAYSEGRFAGCVVRSERYWREWVRDEMGGDDDEPGSRLYVLTDGVGAVGEAVAWLSVRPRGDKFQLREFGLERGGEDASAGLALGALLGIALGGGARVRSASADAGRDGTVPEEPPDLPDRVRLHLPAAVLEEVLSEREEATAGDGGGGGGGGGESFPFIDWDGDIAEEDDVGWMYRPIRPPKEGEPDILGPLLEGGREHLIWPTDSF